MSSEAFVAQRVYMGIQLHTLPRQQCFWLKTISSLVLVCVFGVTLLNGGQAGRERFFLWGTLVPAARNAASHPYISLKYDSHNFRLISRDT